MSVKIMGIVFDLALRTNSKMLLTILGNYADDEGRNIFPSVSTMVKKTGISERQIRRILAELREHKIIVQYDWRNGERGRIPVYRIDIEMACQVFGFVDDNPATVAGSRDGNASAMAKARMQKAATVAGSQNGNPAAVAGSQDRLPANGDRFPATGDATPCQSLAENPSGTVRGNRQSISKKRRTGINGDWSLPPELRGWAIQYAASKNVTGIDWDAEAEQFLDHHLKVGKVMADWNAAWRTWARNAVKWAGERRGRSGSRHGDIAQAFERMDQAVKGSVP